MTKWRIIYNVKRDVFKEDKSAFSKRFEELMKKNNLKLNDVVEIFEEKTKTNSYELIKKWRYGEIT